MTHAHPTSLFAFALAVVTASPVLSAQDTRTVREPVIPPVCTTLRAKLTVAAATSGASEAQASNTGSPNPALDTSRIQSALDRCDKGKAVELTADGPNSAFLAAPFAVPAGVTLLIDKGVTLLAARNAEYFALTPGSCGLVNDDSLNGCRPLISISKAAGAAIMGDGAIDGQGGLPILVDGKPSAKSWWDLADDARNAGHQQAPRLIDADFANDFTLYRITLRNSPSSHLFFHRGAGLTVWGVRIDSPRTARNTDGIDMEEASDITVTQSFIRDGEDNIAIQAPDGPTTHVTLLHDHLYWGHGLTIGNETTAGVSGIRVDDLTLDGPDNGIRIKSTATHGGRVEDVVYNDICIRDSKVPITFDSVYSFPGKAAIQLPVYADITLRNIRIAGGGRLQFNGFDSSHRIEVTLDGVIAVDSPTRYHAGANHTDLTFGPGPVNFIFTGDDSNVTGTAVDGKLPGCAARFVPFP